MKRLVAFVGPPGCGKTTQIRRLEQRLGAASVLAASVRALIRGDEKLLHYLTPEERAQLQSESAEALAARDRGELAPLAFDRALFTIVGRVPHELVLLDGSPRGLAQSRLFLEMLHLLRETLVVRFFFPGDAHRQSIERQVARERANRGEAEAQKKREKFTRKAAVYFSDTLPGTKLLEEAGLRVCDIDATRPESWIANRLELLTGGV